MAATRAETPPGTVALGVVQAPRPAPTRGLEGFRTRRRFPQPVGSAVRYAAGLRFAGRWVSQSGICRTRGEGSNQDWMSAMVLNPRDIRSGAR